MVFEGLLVFLPHFHGGFCLLLLPPRHWKGNIFLVCLPLFIFAFVSAVFWLLFHTPTIWGDSMSCSFPLGGRKTRKTSSVCSVCGIFFICSLCSSVRKAGKVPSVYDFICLLHNFLSPFGLFWPAWLAFLLFSIEMGKFIWEWLCLSEKSIILKFSKPEQLKLMGNVWMNAGKCSNQFNLPGFYVCI